jgi:hypothetical protein
MVGTVSCCCSVVFVAKIVKCIIICIIATHNANANASELKGCIVYLYNLYSASTFCISIKKDKSGNKNTFLL